MFILLTLDIGKNVASLLNRYASQLSIEDNLDTFIYLVILIN